MSAAGQISCSPAGSFLSVSGQFPLSAGTLRECPEIGVGTCTSVPVDPPSVLVHPMEARQGTLLFLHNLGPSDVLVDVGPQPGREGEPVEMFSDRAYDAAGPELDSLAVAGHGYRWLRLRRTA